MIEQYEAGMAYAREAFDSSPAIEGLFNETIGVDTLEAFLISFSATGVAMTQPVPGWIAAAGRRCRETGLESLGKALEAHASQEDGHHLLMQRDTERLVDRWNRRTGSFLEARHLLSLPPSAGILLYQTLHEETIRGDAPYGQIAIEYEIERLSVIYGPRLLRLCTTVLGPDILGSLSFLSDHVELDVAHTHFNKAQIKRLLTEHPDFISGLINAGSHALNAYATFLNDALMMARTNFTQAPV